MEENEHTAKSIKDQIQHLAWEYAQVTGEVIETIRIDWPRTVVPGALEPVCLRIESYYITKEGR